MASTPVPGSIPLVMRLARVIYRRCNEDVLGMRLKQYSALRQLGEQGPTSQQNLCAALMLDPNNLVLLLNELEDAGYVERRRDPADRRRHIVELTPAGGEALERAERGLETIEDDVLAALTPDERATLRSLLVRTLQPADEPVAAAHA